jgi:hypothetical protein
MSEGHEADALADLLSSPHLIALESLGVSYAMLPPDIFSRLDAAPPGLRAMDVLCASCGDAQLEALTRWEGMRGLESLVWTVNAVSSAGLRALLRSHNTSALRELNMGGNAIDASTLQEDSWARLRRMEAVGLWSAKIDQEVLARMLRQPWPALRWLNLSENPLKLGALRPLMARRGQLPVLRCLDLSNCRLIDADMIELVCQLPPTLRVLSLRSNPLTEDGALALAARPELRQLEELDLSQNALSAASVEALTRSPHTAHMQPDGLKL